jgi:hypothetical protein
MYKIGDKFTATKNYPFDLDEEEVENGLARYDIMNGEEFEIVDIVDGYYEAFNNSCETIVYELMTEEDIALVIS